MNPGAFLYVTTAGTKQACYSAIQDDKMMAAWSHYGCPLFSGQEF